MPRYETSDTAAIQDSIVFIIDDDPGTREAMRELLASVGLRSFAFGSTAEYSAYRRPDLPACLILDMANGLDFQQQVVGQNHPPIIFVTAQADIRSTVRAIQRGAVDFLSKPFCEADLITAISVALARDRDLRAERAARGELEQRLAALTPREREVLPLVVSGLLNKQAAALLGISEITYQIHRSKVMHKMRADSLADLVRIADRLQIPVVHGRRMKLSSSDGWPAASLCVKCRRAVPDQIGSESERGDHLPGACGAEPARSRDPDRLRHIPQSGIDRAGLEPDGARHRAQHRYRRSAGLSDAGRSIG